MTAHHDPGAPNEPSGVRSLVLDDVTLTVVVDGTMLIDRETFFPTIPPRYWSEHPAELDDHGHVVMAAGGLLISRGDHRLLIDAGYGPAHLDSPYGRVDTGQFLRVLGQLGVAPTDIDIVALTHLHVDHTGWTFRPGLHGPEPVFPRAVYRVAARELAAFREGDTPDGAPPSAEIIEPLLRHAVPVDDAELIAPGVSALVTPGHSDGHTSYVVTSSAGRRAVVFGDVFHVPAQLAQPTWHSGPDAAPAAVPSGRARVLAELERPDTVGVGIHFGDQVFGRVRRRPDDTSWWEPVPAPATITPSGGSP